MSTGLVARRSLRVVALFSCLAVTAACGDDGDGGTPDASSDAANTPDAAPADAMVSQALQPICNVTDGLFIDFFNAALACQGDFIAFVIGDVDDQDFSDACFGQFQDYANDGTLTIDTTQLAACRAFIDNIDCATFDFDAPNAACDALFVGTVALGGDCDIQEQCAGDAYCDGAMAGTCGTCTASVANGQACTDDDECSSGYCDTLNVCGDRQPIGGACIDDGDCLGDGTVCDVGNTDQCVAGPTFNVGDACAGGLFGGGCGFPLSGFYCAANDMCAAEVALAGSCAAGELCDVLDYLWCDAGTCAAAVTANVTETCNVGFAGQANKCAAGLSCTDPFSGGVCYVPKEDGESCNDNVDTEQCSFLLECVGGTCVYNEYSGMCPVTP